MTTLDFEELSKFVDRGVGDFDFVGNTPQKCFVYQILGLKIRREDEQLIKWNLNHFTVW